MTSQVTFIKVCDVHPGLSHINTIVKVVSREVKLQCLGSPNRWFAEVVVGDDTGTVILRMQHQNAKLCGAGATLIVRAARVEMFDGRIRLELGRWSRLTPIEDAAFVPNI